MCSLCVTEPIFNISTTTVFGSLWKIMKILQYVHIYDMYVYLLPSSIHPPSIFYLGYSFMCPEFCTQKICNIFCIIFFGHVHFNFFYKNMDIARRWLWFYYYKLKTAHQKKRRKLTAHISTATLYKCYIVAYITKYS